MDVISSFPQIGPYMGVTMDKKITFKTGRNTRIFRVIVNGALNAFGLIGPEKNGIAILDENERAVLADELERESSGYFGPSKNQLIRFNQIRSLDWQGFRALVNNSGRNRYEI
jgi:hypothetical protein